MDFVFGLLALTAMEIVLGIDNLVFITIVSSKLPKDQQPLARRLGLGFALVTRLLLLFTLNFIVNELRDPVFYLSDVGIPQVAIEHVSGAAWNDHAEHPLPESVVKDRMQEANGISWRDIVLFLGGLFLIGKSVFEIHEEFNPTHEHAGTQTPRNFVKVVVQIAILDIVFSLDSVITAVGMVDNIWVMVAAIVIAIIVMVVFAEPVNRFVENHPTLKMLALSFLILIGVMLVAESAGAHMDKGYIYFAMFFALIVELLNMRLRDGSSPAISEAV